MHVDLLGDATDNNEIPAAVTRPMSPVLSPPEADPQALPKEPGARR
jgi:hypothetical protein